MRKLNARLSLRRETLTDLTSPALAGAAGGTFFPPFPFSPLCVSTFRTCYGTIVV